MPGKENGSAVFGVLSSCPLGTLGTSELPRWRLTFQFYSHFNKSKSANALRAALVDRWFAGTAAPGGSAAMRVPAIHTAIRQFSRQFAGNSRQFGAKSGNSDPGGTPKTRAWRQFTTPTDRPFKILKGGAGAGAARDALEFYRPSGRPCLVREQTSGENLRTGMPCPSTNVRKKLAPV